MKKPVLYVLLVLGISLIAAFTGFTTEQVFAIAIFVGFICGTLLFWEFRLAFALVGIALLLGSGLLDVPHLIEFASLDVILFLVGMMILVGYLEEKHFFNWALDKTLPYINHSATKLMTALMIFSFFSAAFVDEVTSILFMAAIMLRVCRHYKVNPVPFIIMIVFATNIGSSATVVGNPVGVLIALRSGYSFPDFLRWASPISIIGLVITTVLSLWYFRKPMAELQASIKRVHQVEKEAGTAAAEETYDSKDMRLPGLLFVLTIAGLIAHKAIEGRAGPRAQRHARRRGPARGGCRTLRHPRPCEAAGRDARRLVDAELLHAAVCLRRYAAVRGGHFPLGRRYDQPDGR